MDTTLIYWLNDPLLTVSEAQILAEPDDIRERQPALVPCGAEAGETPWMWED